MAFDDFGESVPGGSPADETLASARTRSLERAERTFAALLAGPCA